ncbi:LamG-like jellyroll fold domain-containing protein [Catenulispora subtropica]|uniref:PKD domain containing protein n=1 Tax=Catenulispora subtropica TaxID=450798 RepID=A0ABP5EI41_9ACTN
MVATVPADATAHSDGKPTPPKPTVKMLTNAPAQAPRPPGTPHLAPGQETKDPDPTAVAGPSQKAKTAEDPYAAKNAAQLAASTKAKATGKAVDVPELTTERSTTKANPDGTFTASTTFFPQRAKVDGAWTPIDTTLAENADGSWTPKATVAGITLSGGGTGPLATLRIGAKTIAMSWPLGALPAPKTAGDHATYPQVLPGVDLRVSADAEGIREVLVVADRKAAANPALASLAFGLEATGVKLSQSGDGVSATDAVTGRAVFTSPAPIMWDSTHSAAKADSLTTSAADQDRQDPADAPGREAHIATMPVRLQGKTAIVTPSQAMIGDAHTTYPLFIDPPVTLGTTYHYAEVYSNAGLTDSVNFDLPTPNGAHGPIVRAGYDSENGGGYVRGIFSFDVGDAMMGEESDMANPNGGGLPEDGSTITDAELKLTSNNNPCNTNGTNTIAVDVDGVNRMDTDHPPTWSQDGPGGSGHYVGATYYAPVWNGPVNLFSGTPSGCPGAGNTIDVKDSTGGRLTNMVTNVWRNWSGHNGDGWCPCTGDGTATFGIKWTTEAPGPQYGSWEVGGYNGGNIPAALVITYVPAPVINQSPTLTPGNGGTAISTNCDQQAALANTGPGSYIPKNISDSVTLNARFFDRDGGEHIQTQYRFQDLNGGTDQYYPGPGFDNYFATIDSSQGGETDFPPQTITAASGLLREGHTYKFFPRAVDSRNSELDSSAYGFSTACLFTIAFKAPDTPTIVSAPDLPPLGSTTAPVIQRVAGEADPTGITIKGATGGVQIDHFDYVFDGDSSRIPKNGPGCGPGNGCVPAGPNTYIGTNNEPAGYTATVTIPVPAGITTLGKNSLWAQAVDKAGNRSGVFQYHFYLPGNPNAVAVPGDVTGNGYPSIVVAAPDPNHSGVENLVAYPGNVDPDVKSYGVEVAPAAAAPDGQSWADTLITHRGAERGVPVDDLFAFNTNTHAMYYYLNSAVFGSPVPVDAFTGGTPTGGAHRVVVTRPACVPAPDNYNCAGYAPDWGNVTQILALGNAAGGKPGTFAGRTNLITVETDNNHSAHVWMFSPAAAGQLTTPILLSYQVSPFNWADADLIAPGPTTSSGLPDLWVRDRKSGTLYQILNKRNAAGVEDPTSLGDEKNATVIGTAGQYSADDKSVLVSAGNPTMTGAQTSVYPSLWAVTQPGGQLTMLAGSSAGPKVDTYAQAGTWPTSGTSWTTSTGATSVNGGTVASSTGPIQFGVNQGNGAYLCMDLFHGDTTPGNYVQGWECNGTAPQVWTIASDATIRYGSASSTSCLTVSILPAPAQHGLPSAAGNYGSNAGNWARSPVVIDHCPAPGAAPQGTQVWAFRTSTTATQALNGHGWFTVYNPASGMNLDNTGCDHGGGVQLSLYWPADVTCQQWQTPAAQGTWLQALGVGLASITGEPATAPTSTPTGQSTPSGTDYLLAATKVGDHYGVDWYVPSSGTYAVWATLATGPGNGQVQVTVDQAQGGGTQLPMSYDTYTAGAGSNQYLFGDVNLTAGMHSFTFGVVGKNAASSGYAIGLDTLSAGPDHGTGPHAALSASAGTPAVPVLAPASIMLDASKSYPGVSQLAANAYAFDFGDGTTVAAGSAATATHTYTANGVYTASVTVTDSLGVSATTSHLVYVSAPPSGLTTSDDTNTAACATTSATATTVASLTPILAATVSPNLSAQFELRDVTDPSAGPPIAIGGAGSVGSTGPSSQLTTPNLVNGHEYAFAARSVDVDGNISPVSGTCYFWAVTSGGQAAPTGAVSLPLDNTFYPASSAQTWAGPVTTLAWANGNLALTRNSDSAVLWASGTSGAGNVLALQNDGNLVVYSSQPTVDSVGWVSGTALWGAAISGLGDTALLLATDGSLTLRNGSAVQWNAPIATHRWPLTDGQGLSAKDTGSPGGAPATLDTVGVSWPTTTYAAFAGSNRAATAGPVLDTTKSFTVAAWVNLAVTGGTQTMLVQQGTTNSAFYLEYNGSTWQFAIPAADVNAPPVTRITSTAPAAVGVWTHLLGTYDAGTGTMKLYVNGVLNATGTVANSIASNGIFAMGRGFAGGVVNNRFKGMMADVRAYQQAVDAQSAGSIYRSTGFTSPQVPNIAGTLISNNTTAGSPRQICVDDANGSLANSTTVIQVYGCNGTWPQAWKFGTDGTVRIMGSNPAAPPNKCLDTGGVNTSGSKVTLFDCQNGNTNQQWNIVPSTNYPGLISLRNPATNMCLDNPFGNTNDGNQIQLYACLDNSNQDFIPPTTSGMRQKAEGESLWGTVSGGTMSIQTGPEYANGGQQFFSNTVAGSTITLNMYVANAGRYAITPQMTKAADYGTVKASVDGVALANTFDGYYAGGITTAQADFGTVNLTPGAHSFTFTVTGTNTASTGNRYNAGIDTLLLQPTAR